MLTITAIIVAAIGIVLLARIRVPGGVTASDLGSVSEQWLAEYRASHPL